MGRWCSNKNLDAVTNKLDCRLAVSNIKDQLNRSGSVDVVYSNITTRLTCESKDLPRGCVFINNTVFWNHAYGGNNNSKAQQVCIEGKTYNRVIIII